LILSGGRFDDRQEFTLQRATMPLCPPVQPFHEMIRGILY